ncbi:hypothetical protein AXF42_Ash010060 [Apostasia shenzhenica]|uniref:Uncharacterized protein n=1 Tax=Apostasia shenzhenica TaxID=1088818 RepID=A0A2I0ACS0_9ASPA|nr:hypothetical protein AXF42_Ash010060 [Apostasia shenzhenica]
MRAMLADLYPLPLSSVNSCKRRLVREMTEKMEWATLASISKKRAGQSPVDVPPSEKRRLLGPSEGSLKSATVEPVEASKGEEVGVAVVDLEAPLVRVATVLAQTLESVHEPVGMEVTEVVNVSDSSVKPPAKARKLTEVVLVSRTTAGERLAPEKILLKDEEIERLLPRFGAPPGDAKKSPLMVCGLASLGVSIPPSEKKRKPLFPSFLPASP